MATTDSTCVSTWFDEYHRIAAEYRACVIRFQQAMDQLQACERDENAQSVGQPPTLEPSPYFELDKAVARLSQREFEVFALIGRGLTTHEISQQLNLTKSTVETYRERLKSKLHIKSAPALIRQAVLWASHRP